jgi:hypothetical protein
MMVICYGGCKLFSVRSQKMNYLSITILICQLSAENTNLNSESEKKIRSHVWKYIWYVSLVVLRQSLSLLVIQDDHHFTI